MFVTGGHVINNFNRLFNKPENRLYKGLYIFALKPGKTVRNSIFP